MEERWQAMTRAAVEKKAVDWVETEAQKRAEEVARQQGGSGGSRRSRGSRRGLGPEAAQVGSAAYHRIDSEWLESRRGKSCLACMAKKAKCGPTMARPKKQWARCREHGSQVSSDC